jgi:hypothetical protein
MNKNALNVEVEKFKLDTIKIWIYLEILNVLLIFITEFIQLGSKAHGLKIAILLFAIVDRTLQHLMKMRNIFIIFVRADMTG